MWTFLFVRIFLKTIYYYSFWENEPSNIARRKQDQNIFSFFSIKHFKISNCFRPKSYYQIKPPTVGYSGTSFEHNIYPEILLSVLSELISLQIVRAQN